MTASDNGGNSNGGFDQVARTISIIIRPVTFDVWKERNFTAVEQADEEISGPDSNPDGDARVNAWEYALGTDPKAFDAEPNPSAVSGLWQR